MIYDIILRTFFLFLSSSLYFVYIPPTCSTGKTVVFSPAKVSLEYFLPPFFRVSLLYFFTPY